MTDDPDALQLFESSYEISEGICTRTCEVTCSERTTCAWTG